MLCVGASKMALIVLNIGKRLNPPSLVFERSNKMKKKGFTLIELLVVIAIIAMLLAILMPALNKVKKIAMRVICGTNLKGMGTAQTVYANDYADSYAVQGRGYGHTLNAGTTAWNDSAKNWATVGNITVGASLYLLVREADVSPKSFVCPSSDQKEFSGKNVNNLDITNLWDFGSPDYNSEGPAKTVSYAYHMPYAMGQAGAATGAKGTYAATGANSASFAIMGDRNPWLDTKITQKNPAANQTTYLSDVALLNYGVVPADWTSIESWRRQVANAYAHSREGQNVLFGDGHSSNETRSDVGINNDNIYTHFSAATSTNGSHNRLGVAITATASAINAVTGGLSSAGATVTPQSAEDSVLVNDYGL
jgi:prepilin-type N-terminal cleavage/methylation domain-containing protein